MLVEPFPSFVLFVLALYATPGPNTLSIAASGAAVGLRRTLSYIGGILAGLSLIFLMVAAGLGIFFANYPTVHHIFQWISFAYVLYLAYKIGASNSLSGEPGDKPVGFMDGLFICLLNPKAYFAIIATVAQFSVAGEGYVRSFVLLFTWAMLLVIVTNVLWATAGAAIASRITTSRHARLVNWSFAVLLVVSVVIAMFA